MQVNKINNSISMQAKLGQTRVFSAPTPKKQGFYEGYFMEKSPLAKDYVKPETNFLINLYKGIKNSLLNIIKTSK